MLLILLKSLFQKCFKFNNSSLFSPTDKDGSFFNSMFWKMGISSFENFFISFNKVEMKSLTLTREVLKERQQLETLIPGLQFQVQVGLNQMDAIQQEEKALKVHQKSIMENKDFNYQVKVQKNQASEIAYWYQYDRQPVGNAVLLAMPIANFLMTEAKQIAMP